MAKIIQKFISKEQKKQRPGYSMAPKYITVHNTANASKGANAEMHARYLLNGAGGRTVGWHFTVDDKEIYQHLPVNESGWHAGDGNGAGNRQSIGIEICENSDGNFEKAVANAQDLIEKLMRDHNIPKSNVVPHKKWTGKNCPHLLLGRWDSFIHGINPEKTVVVETQVSGVSSKKPTAPKAYTGNSIVDYLNSIGVSSTYGNRAKLAAQYGISGYAGTAAQNTQLLNAMRNGKPAPKPAAKKGDQKTSSIVDYLKSIGESSSFANRKKLATKYGIKNYSGTAAQNTQLLKKMRG